MPLLIWQILNVRFSLHNYWKIVWTWKSSHIFHILKFYISFLVLSNKSGINMLEKPWKVPFWGHKIPSRVSCNHIELSKSILLIAFFFFSVLTKYNKNNIKNDYNQCFIGNHFKDEYNKKSFPRKIWLIILKDVTENDRTLLEWRYEVKISG